MRALIVDDDSLVQQSLAHLLAPRFESLFADDGNQALEIAEKEKLDAILLDIQLPEMDGIQTCKALRKIPSGREIPIIMITGTQNEEVRCQALLAGADDLVSKPFRSKELLVRLNRQLERHEAEELVQLGNLVLNRSTLSATVNGGRIELSALEFRLIEFLVRNADRVVGRDKIAKNVWPGKKATGRAVDARVAALRRKLEGFDHQIVPLYRAGYRLVQSRQIVPNDGSEVRS